MKQQITKEQWNELESKEKDKLQDILFGKGMRFGFTGNVSIGQMIEFLGDDLLRIDFESKEWILKEEGILAVGNLPTFYWDKESIDGGWEAVKYKLN